MKSVIFYRSHYGNTRAIADVLAREMIAEGHDAVVKDVRDRLPDMRDIDLAMVGSPTRMGRANGRAVRLIKRLRGSGFTGKSIALFDTYGPLPATEAEMEKGRHYIEPGAVGHLRKAAIDQGLPVYDHDLRCEVTGMKGPLKEQDVQKATTFAREFITAAEK